MRGKEGKIRRWKLGLRDSLKRNKNGIRVSENSKFFFKRLEYRHRISYPSQISWCLLETKSPSKPSLPRRPAPRRPFPNNPKRIKNRNSNPRKPTSSRRLPKPMLSITLQIPAPKSISSNSNPNKKLTNSTSTKLPINN